MESLPASQRSSVADASSAQGGEMSSVALEAGELRTSLTDLVTTADRLLEAARQFQR